MRPLLAELARLPLVERIQLAPLADVDMAALVRFLQDDAPLADEDVTRIVGRAEGNAFYAEQLLQARQDGDREPLPGALADVLLTRLEQLPAAAQRVVRTAAVAGRRVQHGLLLEATGLGDAELDAALREAVTRHVLVRSTGRPTPSGTRCSGRPPTPTCYPASGSAPTRGSPSCWTAASAGPAGQPSWPTTAGRATICPGR